MRKGEIKIQGKTCCQRIRAKKERDYFEIFSPVARHVSIRLILSIAASAGMKIMTSDVRTAFLHGELDEKIFMYQPEKFSDNSGRICELKKNLYG